MFHSLPDYDGRGFAKALLQVGTTAADAALPAPDLAVWTLTASEILNLDETLTR